MVKLTAELIEQAAQYTNAVRDRELDLRGELDGAQAVSEPWRAAARRRPRRVRGGWSLARGPLPGPGVPPIDGPQDPLGLSATRAPASQHGASIPSPVRTH